MFRTHVCDARRACLVGGGCCGFSNGSTASIMSDVTRILSQIESGDPSAAEQLLPLVYEELRKLAAYFGALLVLRVVFLVDAGAAPPLHGGAAIRSGWRPPSPEPPPAPRRRGETC